MRYISTRGQAPELSFADVVLTGLARDGGLYVPAEWPQVSRAHLQRWRSLPYHALAAEVLQLFVGEDIAPDVLARLCRDAYGHFAHTAVVPLRQLDDQLWLMEQYHGPTLAFKDLAMQLLGRVLDHLLAERGAHCTIVGATSGDTGSAAIEAVRGRENISMFMLHPQGRVSEVQRRQMTTVQEPNIHNLAVRGTFDDCQHLVKSMFNDLPFRDRHQLSAVNSINWLRIAAQVVYYFRAALALGAPERAVSFSVPSGNFGNVFAGYVAMRMGLPVEQLVVGANRNDILTRFFNSGAMTTAEVVPSLSPSMDIQVSSNFERLLFELAGRETTQVRHWMQSFAETGHYQVTDALHREALGHFSSARFDDEETVELMRQALTRADLLVDPHTAIGIGAAQACWRDRQTPMVVLATAHPAKFAKACQAATGTAAPLPARVAHIMQAEERLSEVAADLAAVQAQVDKAAGR